ncbi:hypothetical protein, partial [Nocardia noduli]|uniref:hypothetical protein n=1 Tax=Nocardia noduli TaxID=2815722 RepID=UPI001C23CE28
VVGRSGGGAGDVVSEFLALRYVLDAVKAVMRAYRGRGDITRSLLVNETILIPLRTVENLLRARTLTGRDRRGGVGGDGR